MQREQDRAAELNDQQIYELFRCALVERDENAWAEIYSRYQSLVGYWVLQSGAFAASDESCEYFINAAFIKLWRSITPERFASFNNVAALFSYLKRCVLTTLIDSARTQTRAEQGLTEARGSAMAETASPDDTVESRIHREEFWCWVSQHLGNDLERMVIYHSYVVGMKPREILRWRGDLFADIAEVYLAKRNALERLKQSRDVRVWAS